MTYLALNAVFMAVAAAVAAVAVWRRRGRQTGRGAASVAVALLIVMLLTAVFDNVMIAAGLFTYEPGLISGLAVGLAPIEDFAYPVAAALLLPALWSLLGGPSPTRGRPRAEAAR
ncbi:lycopene cyclase domain-containing protein [Cryobacterium melibiosiphilum]|uniref:Lycopene cyclase domain-containing protein n=1 Tax=Cryobacterium melibiosiphilum TaxID=995039 RepID=A0A3A5MF24_9MICO|nr:lycopene cyclase domain-containing protein [Cryobacterium melibiosiphilum]RJT88740.1 lycopene cyclase domain-containing protein [Cryobacterium melibiosiphilum]